MRYSEAKLGRVFVIRLENGEVIHETIESFAQENGIRSAALMVVGAADAGSKLVVGPRKGSEVPAVPMEIILSDAHEITGVGTIFEDESGKPVLHMHISAGRGESAKAGCVRRGVKVWLVLEVIIFELTESIAKRRNDPKTGFELLSPD